VTRGVVRRDLDTAAIVSPGRHARQPSSSRSSLPCPCRAGLPALTLRKRVRHRRVAPGVILDAAPSRKRRRRVRSRGAPLCPAPLHAGRGPRV
jgi:hypothetical protein